MSTMADIAQSGIQKIMVHEDAPRVMLIVFTDGSALQLDISPLEPETIN